MVKISPALTPVLQERLLLVSGAIRLPERADRAAARGVWKKMIAAMNAAMDLEEPEKLKPIGVKDTYWTKLQRYDPDYAAFIEEEPTIGATFQSLQMNAKAVLERRYPTVTITDVTGNHPVKVEPHGVEQLSFLIYADTVENPSRLIDDFAASALILPQVQVFMDCFPETYSGLLQVVQTLMAKKWPAGKDELPPLWMQDQLTILFQEELGTGLSVSEPEVKPPKPQRNIKLNIDSHKSPADAVL